MTLTTFHYQVSFVFFAMIFILVLSNLMRKADLDTNVVQNIKNNYDLSIKESEEFDIKLKSIFIYPIRGVQGIEVKECELGPHGIKKDRNWVIIDKKKMKQVDNVSNHTLSFLRLALHPENQNDLEISLQDDECFLDLETRCHMLSFDKEYPETDFIECKQNICGYKESDTINNWLSSILDLPVILLRS